MRKLSGIRIALAMINLLLAALLVATIILIAGLREANFTLQAIRKATETMNEDIQHLHEQVEANGDALDDLRSMVEPPSKK